MDQGDGTFAPIPEAVVEAFDLLRKKTPQVMTAEDIENLWPRLFVVGTEVDIRKSRFRIEYIGTDVLVLKLLPADASREREDG